MRQLDLERHRHRHGGMRELNAQLFIGPGDVVPLLVAVICATGIEPECAKGLRADCLSSPARGYVSLAYVKKRAHTRIAKTMRVRDGGLQTGGGLIRLAMRLTEPARQALGVTGVWAGAGDHGLTEFFASGHQMNTQVLAWMARHRLDELTDHGGGPVRLDLRRLRKSVKSRQYLASGGECQILCARGFSPPGTGSLSATFSSHYLKFYCPVYSPVSRNPAYRTLPGLILRVRISRAIPARGGRLLPDPPRIAWRLFPPGIKHTRR
jgi:hypothetical protein